MGTYQNKLALSLSTTYQTDTKIFKKSYTETQTQHNTISQTLVGTLKKLTSVKIFKYRRVLRIFKNGTSRVVDVTPIREAGAGALSAYKTRTEPRHDYLP